MFPSSKDLRYLLPWSPVEQVIGWLRDKANHLNHPILPPPLALMGDDGEKFGMWPGTFEHCWTNGYMDRLFSAIEANADWLETTTPGAYLRQYPGARSRLSADRLLPGNDRVGAARRTDARDQEHPHRHGARDRPEAVERAGAVGVSAPGAALHARRLLAQLSWRSIPKSTRCRNAACTPAAACTRCRTATAKRARSSTCGRRSVTALTGTASLAASICSTSGRRITPTCSTPKR